MPTIFTARIPITRELRRAEIERNYETATGLVIVERFSRLNPVEMPGALVAQHGPFAWGPSATIAMQNAVVLEEVARLALDTLRLNPEAAPVSPFLLEKHFLRKHGPAAYYGQSGH